MINIYFLILGYFLIFISLILVYYRLKKIELTREDYLDFERIDKTFSVLKNKLFQLLKISEREIIFLWYNLVEKILRRVKIEALKIENWASKRLESLKKKENEKSV